MRGLRFFLILCMILLVIVLCSGGDLNIGDANETDGSDSVAESESQSAGETDSSESTAESEIQCEHDRTDEVAVYVENCQHGGLYNIVCRDCGEIVDTMNAEMLAHVEGEPIVDSEPTCTEEGSYHVECIACGEVLRIEMTADLGGHVLSSWKIEIVTGAVAEGRKYRECSRCEYKEYEVNYTVSGYGRATIADNESAARLYDLLEEAVLADEPAKEIEVDPSLEIKMEDFDLAEIMFLSDHPECFWWDGQVVYYYTEDGIIVSIKFTYLYDNDEISAMKAELERVVEEILAELPVGNNFGKALYLHDAVANRVTYKYTENDQTPYGALVEGEAVCNGYATAYQLLLQRAGIRAWTVNGTSLDEAHAWNVVWMDDDTCVYTDVTWDDVEYLSHYYFNMSLDEIAKEHEADAIFDLPDCGHNDQGYYDVNAENTLRDGDGANVLASFFGESENGEKIASSRYLGEDISAWLEENGADFYPLVGATSLRYLIVGNEIIMIAYV